MVLHLVVSHHEDEVVRPLGLRVDVLSGDALRGVLEQGVLEPLVPGADEVDKKSKSCSI